MTRIKTATCQFCGEKSNEIGNDYCSDECRNNARNSN